MTPAEELVPRVGMTAWNRDDGSELLVTSGIPDLSGNNRVLQATGNDPTSFAAAPEANDRRAWTFGGPMAAAFSNTLRHAFIVASFPSAAFSAAKGLFSDQATTPVLVSDTSGTTFHDYSFTPYSYRKSNVLYAAASQQAPMDGVPALIEIQLPTSIALDGNQIGADREESGTTWPGKFWELITYSQVLSDLHRRDLYEYIACWYRLWQKAGDGKNVFPFLPNWAVPVASDKVVLSSKLPSGQIKSRSKSVALDAMELKFEGRSADEYAAARAFWDGHYPGTSFIYRDLSVSPAVDREFFFASGLTKQGNSYHDIDYSFQIVEAP